jgi:hypothetical protein
MRNVLFVLIATAGIAFTGASVANAASANGAVIEKASQNADQTIMVRDGCGRGRHWSRWQGHCVWN